MLLRWTKAIAVSGFWMATRLDWRDCIARYYDTAWMIVNLCRPSKHATAVVISKRNLSCSECVMRYSPLGTCGQPNDTFVPSHTNRIATMGCWCFTEIANIVEAKDCWARAYGEDIGWPDEIRPHKQNGIEGVEIPAE